MNLYYTSKLFCTLLTSNWEVSTGPSPYCFINFAQTKQKFVISLYIDDIETNFPIGKHPLRVVTLKFEDIVGKNLFRCFIYVFFSICCISCHFLRLML